MEKYNEKIVLSLKNQIISQIDNFEYNEEIIKKMRSAIKTEPRLIECASIITIKNNELITNYMAKNEKNRTNDILNLLKKSIEYIKNKKMNFPNTTLFFYISDVYSYEHQDFPFIIMAKPKNKKGILIPDNTFECHNVPGSECERWSKTVDICKKNQVELKNKKNKIFFIGANTDKNRQNIRENLYKLSNKQIIYGIKTDKLPLEIHLSKRIHICDFSNYKYLLNLPGNQPWSYRFKYLFLMNSVVINIDVRQKYKYLNKFNDTWINFFDSIFEPNIDYINLPFFWKENDDAYNEYEFKKLISNLKETYHLLENNSDQYNKIRESGYNKAQIITDDLIYESIFLIVHYYSKKINDYL